MDAKTYWNNFYQNEKNHSINVNPFLEKMLPRLQKGKVLDIGSGLGVNSIYLAKAGFDVRGIDISNQATQMAETKVRTEKNLKIKFETADLDLFILGLMEYDSIVMMNFKPSLSRHYSELIRSLKQGGILLIQSPTIEEMHEIISQEENYRNIYYQSNEVLKNLSGMRILYYSEIEKDGRHLVECLAQKPLDKDVAKYNLFDMSSSSAAKPQSKHAELAEALFKKK